jgi:hypothetical protein
MKYNIKIKHKEATEILEGIDEIELLDDGYILMSSGKEVIADINISDIEKIEFLGS